MEKPKFGDTVLVPMEVVGIESGVYELLFKSEKLFLTEDEVRHVLLANGGRNEGF